MPLGNWRQVLLSGPYAVKIPREEPDRAAGARCLNRWEAEMWHVWRPKFGWAHLCPVVWADPAGHVLIMQRAVRAATREEIDAIAGEAYPEPTCEYKPEDWGHLEDGRLVVFDYGYACDNEAEIAAQRAYYGALAARREGNQ